MKIMSDDQLQERINSFMTRKLQQFPDLAERETPRRDKSNILSRVQELTSYLPHMHNPRQVQQ